MSTSSTPVPSSGYASPAPLLTATPAPPKPNPHPKPKPVNVFSNDGSFLERFQRLKKVCTLPMYAEWIFRRNRVERIRLQEEDEKKKQEDILVKYVFCRHRIYPRELIVFATGSVNSTVVS